MRHCRECGQYKDETEFYKISRAYQGKNGIINYVNYRKECINCHKHVKRRREITNTYGLTLEQYDEFIEKQDNSCAICSISFLDTEYNPYIDHCHTTGIVRGLLCNNCNFGLGQFNDSPELLNNAIAYLSEFSCKLPSPKE